MASTARDVDAFLVTYPPAVRATAQAARATIRRILPDVMETLDPSARVIGYGYGPGYSDTICTIILSQKGVKVGIVGGATLPDPDKLLDGSGKVHRYVDLHTDGAKREAGLVRILRAAYAKWKKK